MKVSPIKKNNTSFKSSYFEDYNYKYKELIYLISQKAQNRHAELVSASYQQSDPETSSG